MTDAPSLKTAPELGDMKALSIMQPWATLITLGRKTIETRPQRTQHRGPLAIHASSTMPVSYGSVLEVGPYRVTRERVPGEPVDRLWLTYGQWTRPNAPVTRRRLWQGCVLGYAQVVDCAAIPVAKMAAAERGELLLGDYTEGRFGWFLARATGLTPPLIVPGKQGLWRVPLKVQTLIETDLATRSVVADPTEDDHA